MKRIFLVLLALLFLVASVSANTVLNFQQPADFSQQVTCSSPGCTWYESTNGGNNYITPANVGAIVTNANPSPMQYAAITNFNGGSGGNVYTYYYDSGKNLMTSLIIGGFAGGSPSRIEVRVVGGQAYVYQDGVLRGTSSVMGQNPSYIGFANSIGFDDAVWGSSAPLDSNASDKYVYGMPETSSTGNPLYVIMRDFINPSANGFYYGNGTLINSNYFFSTFSKGNANNDTINLQGYTTGVNVLSNTTGTAYTGTISWSLASFFAANPNYGLYAMHSSSSLIYSSLITYIGNGAAISWSKPTYSQGENGAIITVVAAGGYWNPTIYNYRIDVVNSNGVVQATYPVTSQTSTTTHTWSATQPIGIYYAEIIAIPKAGGSDILMNYAVCNVNAYLTLYGYVFDAQTTNVIPNATVAVLQAITWANTTTPASGYYSASNMSEGASISIVVNATGYETYNTMFTPLRVGSIQLNFTLMPSSPTYTGVALGGIARTPPYNQTINSATIYIQNATAGGNFTAVTNSVGFYIQNNMPNNYWWSIWGSKIPGFQNSTVYTDLVTGS